MTLWRATRRLTSGNQTATYCRVRGTATFHNTTRPMKQKTCAAQERGALGSEIGKRAEDQRARGRTDLEEHRERRDRPHLFTLGNCADRHGHQRRVVERDPDADDDRADEHADRARPQEQHRQSYAREAHRDARRRWACPMRSGTVAATTRISRQTPAYVANTHFDPSSPTVTE